LGSMLLRDGLCNLFELIDAIDVSCGGAGCVFFLTSRVSLDLLSLLRLPFDYRCISRSVLSWTDLVFIIIYQFKYYRYAQSLKCWEKDIFRLLWRDV
jgi:hypothetical protein